MSLLMRRNVPSSSPPWSDSLSSSPIANGLCRALSKQENGVENTEVMMAPVMGEMGLLRRINKRCMTSCAFVRMRRKNNMIRNSGVVAEPKVCASPGDFDEVNCEQ